MFIFQIYIFEKIGSKYIRDIRRELIIQLLKKIFIIINRKIIFSFINIYIKGI